MDDLLDKEQQMAAKKKTKTKKSGRVRNIHLPERTRHRIGIRLVCDEPLLVHRFAEKAITEILAKNRKIPYEKPPKDPHQEYRDAKYLNVKDQDVIPIMAIKNAMVDAVSLVFGKTELTAKAAKGAFYLKGQCALLCFDEETMHIAPVRLGRGSTDIRFRPEYHGWHTDVVIDYDPNMVTLEQLLHLLRTAGQSIGLAEWRVQKNGNHGTFDIELLPDGEMKRIIKESSVPPKPLVLPKWVMREMNLDETKQLMIDAKNKSPAKKKPPAKSKKRKAA